jgi:hypothetical protein
VNATDARTIAARLGIDEVHVRRLQARGYLLSLPLEEPEVRERLFRAHCAYAAAPLHRRAAGPPELRRSYASVAGAFFSGSFFVSPPVSVFSGLSPSRAALRPPRP